MEWLTPDVPTTGLEDDVNEAAAAVEEAVDSTVAMQRHAVLLVRELDALKEFVAACDADSVHAACKGFGTDETALSSIICGRTKVT